MKPRRKPKSDRNKLLVELREKDPEKYTFEKLGKVFKINRERAYYIYKRDKEKYGKKN